MASPILAPGERRFAQTYSIRILLGLLFLSTALVLPIRQEGVRVESVLGTKEFLWPEIAETRYLVTPINYGHLGLIGLLVSASGRGKAANLSLRVIGKEGKQIKVTSNFRNAREAIRIILGRILPTMVAEVSARVKRGETVQFGPVSLSPAGVSWKSKEPIPFSEIAQADLAGSKLRVKRAGKWLDAVSVRSDKVPNVLVFLEVLESFSPSMKGSGLDPLARVRF